MSAACPNFGSTSEVSLYYAVEPSTATEDLAGATMTWHQVPITGESMDAALTSAVSEQITANRSYANSRLVQGEVTGGFNFEAQAGNFFYDMLICVLQANKLLAASGSGNWASGPIQNGSTKHCLSFVKRVRVSATKFDWYIFRGCQVGSLSLNIAPNALITGAVTVMGVRPQAPIEDAAKPANWTLTDVPVAPLMSGTDSLQDFDIKVNSTSTGVTMQNLTITLENQLRQQQAVGLGHPFSAGIGSGRFSATYAGQAYYANPAIFASFLADEKLNIAGDLVDGDGDGLSFASDFVKVTSGSLPMASAPDQDLMIATEFQAFETSSTGTIKITKVIGT